MKHFISRRVMPQSPASPIMCVVKKINLDDQELIKLTFLTWEKSYESLMSRCSNSFSKFDVRHIKVMIRQLRLMHRKSDLLRFVTWVFPSNRFLFIKFSFPPLKQWLISAPKTMTSFRPYNNDSFPPLKQWLVSASKLDSFSPLKQWLVSAPKTMTRFRS